MRFKPLRAVRRRLPDFRSLSRRRRLAIAVAGGLSLLVIAFAALPAQSEPRSKEEGGVLSSSRRPTPTGAWRPAAVEPWEADFAAPDCCRPREAGGDSAPLGPTAKPRPTAAAAAPTPTVTAAATLPQPGDGGIELNGFEQDLLAAHNAARVGAGLKPFELDASVTAVARARAAHLMAERRLSHVSYGGATAYTLLAAAGVTFLAAAENIELNTYADAESVDVAMTDFRGSAPHRENVLDPRLTRVGIGALVEGRFKYYAVVFVGP